MPELVGLRFSPWTERARWALDARHIAYTFRAYKPMLGEPGLRWQQSRWAGNVSVPMLIGDDGLVLDDSVDIARWAANHGHGPTLFPAAYELTMQRLIELSDQALAAGRGLALRRMLDDDEALVENVPGGLRRVLGPLAAKLGALGVQRTLRKYGTKDDDEKSQTQRLISALTELRQAIATAPPGTPTTLAGTFTFADITAAQALVFIEPPASGLEIRPASRRSFTNPELRDSYQDLIAWRDALYAAYRQPG